MAPLVIVLAALGGCGPRRIYVRSNSIAMISGRTIPVRSDSQSRAAGLRNCGAMNRQ
jgi:hypothetical protein